MRDLVAIDCETCGGSGWYAPAFSATVEINCDRCNPDMLTTRQLRQRQARDAKGRK